MKGVSEIIAIILILMIVIALAALAYTWFSGVFAQLTGQTSTAVQNTANQMGYQFAVDTAKGTNGVATISLVVRNTGTQTIAASSLSAYINDNPCTVPAIAAIAPGSFNPLATITCTGFTCACTANVCYLSSGLVESLKVTVGTGLAQTATVTC